jgi:RNase P/RNase MRP subunit POP5
MPRRYLSLKIICDRAVTNEQFHEALDNSAKRYFGEIGLSRIDPRIMKFDPESSTAILSCERAATSELVSVISLITHCAETPVNLLVLRISGTVKGAERRRK